MERSYIISPNAGISNSVGITSATNPEVNPYSSISYGIFRCNKTDLDFISSNSNTPYISAKTSATTGVNVTSLSINTVQCSEGDLLLVFGGTGNNTTWLSESGWTLQTQSGLTSNLVVYSRIATNSEPSTYTFDVDPAFLADLTLIMICIKNWKSYTVGTFGASGVNPTISVPDDTSTKKLLLFFIGNNGSGRSWDINTITEFQISLVNTNVSLDLDAIYRTSSNTSLSYTTTQTGQGNSHGLTIVVK